MTWLIYGNSAKFSDREALANSVDPDQTAPPGQAFYQPLICWSFSDFLGRTSLFLL